MTKTSARKGPSRRLVIAAGLSAAGGLAIGVASNEESREGINDWKRNRLIKAGADIIVGDYRQLDQLLQLLPSDL